jgi:hypothetical protein
MPNGRHGPGKQLPFPTVPTKGSTHRAKSSLLAATTDIAAAVRISPNRILIYSPFAKSTPSPVAYLHITNSTSKAIKGWQLTSRNLRDGDCVMEAGVIK